MAGTVLLVQPMTEREGRAPSGIALASNDVLEEVARLEDALGRLAQDEHGIDALVLPPDLEEPLDIAQRAHALDPELAIVMVCPPERCVQIARALEFAPFLGEDVIVVSSAEESALAGEVAEAAERARRRRDLRDLGEPPVSKPRPAEQYLGQLLGHAPSGVAVVDTNGAVIGWNTRAGQIFGTTEREVVGTSLGDLFDDGAAVSDLIGRATVDAPPPTLVFARVSAAGKPQFVELTAAGLTGRAGKPGVMVVLRDVTERVTAADERRWMEEALRFQKTLLESQSEASTEGTLVVSREGRILSFNRRFGELWDLAQNEVELRSGEAARLALEQTLTRPDDFFERFVALSDDANETEREELTLRDGRMFEVYSAPVKNSKGAHYGRVWFFRDLTDTKRAEERLRYLAEATEILASSLDYEQTLGTVAKLAIPTLADWCVVDELREDGGIARVAVAAASAEKQALVEELRDRYPPTWDSPQPAARALREGEVVVFGELSPDAIRELVFDERHFELMRELDPRAALALPLKAHGQTLGVITFAFSESGRRYSPSDISLATE
ncbi:MAG: PAS domain S-box protein, partial [Actinobacteria bacterium]|nr:PAS domain S-box protein [Actinomycetota bacterium]